ncbi:methyltransferase domain-containing protein [Photobacterium sp. CAU 1568]|uniref:Methyltransferase domain-containing protein n=1 Tax=Photobacterium arenosum TaxID=2774143 RepID=A0ABR9BRX4_9GAMM|nr:class I SAM-dependent methyltransferase [Photobacterium arenosum]MBD8514251.1 methyltransferase domain-containing protein [Photobacterium arenosum]
MDAADSFNGYLTTNLAFLLTEVDFWQVFDDELRFASSQVVLDHLERYQHLLPFTVNELLSFTVKLGIVEKSQNTKFMLTDLGRSWATYSAFSTWLVGGYGDYIRRSILDGTQSAAREAINGHYVAVGSQMANSAFMLDAYINVLKEYQPRYIVDLGCGVGKRLIHAVEEVSTCRAIGVDINAEAIKAAAELVAQHGVSAQIKLIQGDALAVADEVRGAIGNDLDVVMSFMSMHDLFNIYGPEEAARKVVKEFGQPKYIWVADTVKAKNDDIQVKEIFSNGFEMVHAMQQINIFPEETYIHAFNFAGAELIDKQYLNVPNTYLMIFKVLESK